jgi:hypothetical protein
MNECIEKSSDRNGNLEVPVYFLKAKQGHAIRKMRKTYTFDKCRYEIW